MKWGLLGLGALALLAVAFATLQGVGRRPEARLVVTPPVATAPSDGSAFVIRPAPPPAPGSPDPDAGKPNLDAVMQRLRNSPPPAAPVAPPGSNVVVVTPAPAPAPTPAPVAAQPQPPPPDAAARWTNVSSLGARWRLNPGAALMTLSIDLGNGQVADVHVQPAFANLDSAAANMRVDYLKQTILQSFSARSATYSFGRDGSITLER